MEEYGGGACSEEGGGAKSRSGRVEGRRSGRSRGQERAESEKRSGRLEEEEEEEERAELPHRRRRRRRGVCAGHMVEAPSPVSCPARRRALPQEAAALRCCRVARRSRPRPVPMRRARELHRRQPRAAR